MIATAAEPGEWRLNRRVSLSGLIELILLGSLIVGSWFNLQRQLDLVSHDVALLLERQKDLCTRLETLHEKTISHEYRLRAVEAAQGRQSRSSGRQDFQESYGQ
ncbi:MAG TPA: hypothetical protein P5279_00225 [Anaerohalosphaeraceae bacterium]|jgi:hypothetical protein|nr:hypothetical protein [Anaerohalosphaeraceae bacterium]HRT48890.1 hypothetical protein [Anaerohalosphaeraceae bacterium]HRT85013.1 hypothetical protein [Anaerohalosphaeraceae bacterium]